MGTPSAPAPQPLRLSPALQQLINSAFDRGHPLSLAYVDGQGRPELSFRGSLQTHGESALAIWVRNPEGGLLKAIRLGHVHLVAIYGEVSAQRSFLTFRGRGRIDDSPAQRQRVYSAAPARERDRDPQQRGVPLIIELDSVEGIFQGEMLQMRR